MTLKQLKDELQKVNKQVNATWSTGDQSKIYLVFSKILEHLIDKEEKRTKIVQNKHVMHAPFYAYEKRKKEELDKKQKEKKL